VPILQLALTSKSLPEQELYDYGKLHPDPTGDGAGCGRAAAFGGKVRQIMVDIDSRACRHAACRRWMWSMPSMPRTSFCRAHGQDRLARVQRQLERQHQTVEALNDLPVKHLLERQVIYVRDVAHVR